MQAEDAPADIAGDERRSQLIAQSERRQNLPVALALLQLLIRHLNQTADGLSAMYQRSELVHIILEKLVLDKLRCRLLQNVIRHRAGKEQRRRINRREKGRLDGNYLSQLFERFALQSAEV